MNEIINILNTIVNDQYFFIFLSILFMIFLVLIVALIKTRKDMENYVIYKKQILPESNTLEEDLLNSILGEEEDNDIDEVIKYELSEEENAVISTDELEQRKIEKFNELGVTSNQALIDKYEEEQEKKAIICYEELLKNASNITLTYKEEKLEEGAPKVNKIELNLEDISQPQNYEDEEEFLELLKEFMTNLPKA